MEELPELPFEQVLSYLSLKDRLKARAVSRAWRNKFDRFPVKTLCYSNRPIGRILGKSHWISRTFAENFISTTRFTLFFDIFGQKILSSLKHLHFCQLDMAGRNRIAFVRILNSFRKLEELNIVHVKWNPPVVFILNLPMLTSIQLVEVDGIEKLTLKAPRLRKVKHLDHYGRDLRLQIVHGESVERLLVDRLDYTKVKKMKNLKALYFRNGLTEEIDSKLLSSLQQLKEIHTNNPKNVSKLFELKQRSGRADLEIYLGGLLLNGPDDPALYAFRGSCSHFLFKEWLACLAENRSRWADVIPFYRELDYTDMEGFALGLEVDLVKRFTDLHYVRVLRPVQDPQRFLNLLKNFKNIVELKLTCDQPQGLFDRLPEHSIVQRLEVHHPPSDLELLFRLKHLICLEIIWSIDIKSIRRAFQKLPLLSWFLFRYNGKLASIEIEQSKQYRVWVDGTQSTVSGLNAAIEIITGNKKPSTPKKRKAKNLK